MFKKIDENYRGEVDENDLSWALRNYGIQLNEDEVRVLYGAYTGNSQFDYNAFMADLNVVHSPARKELVLKFYNKLNEPELVFQV